MITVLESPQPEGWNSIESGEERLLGSQLRVLHSVTAESQPKVLNHCIEHVMSDMLHFIISINSKLSPCILYIFDSFIAR